MSSQQQGQTNLPPMTMRQPYKPEEARSPNPAHAQAPPPLSSSPHSRPSPRTSSHPLAPPQQYNDHRLSPRTGHSESYRYEQQRSPAQRPMEMEASSVSPRSRPEFGRMKHEEQQYHSSLPPRHSNNNGLEHRYAKPVEDIVAEKKEQRQHVDEDYDESAADALLSMGNPQLGQKRGLSHEQKDTKKPRNQQEEPSTATPMDIDIPKEDNITKEQQQEITEPEEKEEGENDEEEKVQIKQEEEQEEGEVDEKEEGEVKDDDELTEEKKEIVPTAAVAATNAASVAASQSKEENSNNSPVDEPAGSA
ncbi:hypothetical protein BDF21DRAFT_431766 [Thamnidium elegans]|nr:hypothetical protein BDF21DRAFT_431766 [Thamnidium elegans]